MGNSKNVKKYNYKNIALALAVMLLVILALGSSCSKKEEESGKGKISVPDIAAPIVSVKKAAPVVIPFKVEGLEKNFRYFNVRNSEAVGTGDLLLLNSAFRFDGVPGDLVSNYEYLFDKAGNQIGASASTVNMGSKRMLQAYNEMLIGFYEKTGKTSVMLTDIYLEDGGEGKKCFEHESGLSFDLRLYLEAEKSFPEFTGTGEYAWFGQNSYKYGFILRYPEDKADVTGVQGIANHFRYVGKPHAEIMRANGFCLEEYLDWIKQFTIEQPLSFECEDGERYAVYYFAASNEKTTNIPIPLDSTDTEYTHSISGDNREGYVITVSIPAD